MTQGAPIQIAALGEVWHEPEQNRIKAALCADLTASPEANIWIGYFRQCNAFFVRESPDTAKFFSQSMTDAATTTSFGNLPRLAGYRVGEVFTEKELWPTVSSFFLLSLAWLWTTGMAFWRPRQRQFDLHRAWMTRSYSLTFGAVTVRALALPLALLSQDPRFAAIAAAWSRSIS